MKYITQNEKETLALGKTLAKGLVGGEVLALSGDLGAGKTVLAKGLASALGIKSVITSPTFVLMKVYDVRNKALKIKKFVHIDCYRIDSPAAIEGIGARDYFKQSDSVVLIEWAERIKWILPAKTIKINIKILGGDKREIKVTN